MQVLDHGHIEVVDSMGSDLTVVNAARVSFAKASEWRVIHKATNKAMTPREVTEQADRFILGHLFLEERDVKLIQYLAKHNHWTPFGHAQVTLNFKMPIFVRNQFMRSTIGLVYTEDNEVVPLGSAYDESDPVINEISRRYVDEPPKFYTPGEWRGRPEKSMKQGSAGVVQLPKWPEKNSRRYLIDDGFSTDEEPFNEIVADRYKNLLHAGVAPEQARINLPVSMYTEFWATMSLAAAARIYKLRIDSHAQWEVRQYAAAMEVLLAPLFPRSWEALIGYPLYHVNAGRPPDVAR